MESIAQFAHISSGYGSGCGYGSGDGCGYGSGYGDGYGDGYDDGDGSGRDDAVKSINNQKIYIIDDVQTIITHVRGNVSKGFILCSDLTLTPCYIAKNGNMFAHGESLKQAVSDLQEKMFDGMSEEERIESFVSEFSNLTTIVENEKLFVWHNRLTGSCEMGRKQFVSEKQIDINGKMSVADFINLTKNSYGAKTINKLKERYEEKAK